MSGPENFNQPHIRTYWELGTYPDVGATVEVALLEGTEGMSIHPRHLVARRVGTTGVIDGHVPGHGGDVWFVEHDGDDTEVVCAYSVSELAPRNLETDK